MYPPFPRLSFPLSCFPSNSPMLVKSRVHPLCSHTSARERSWGKAHNFRISVASVSVGQCCSNKQPQLSGPYTSKAHFSLTVNGQCSTASRCVALRHSVFPVASTSMEPHSQSREREKRGHGEHPSSRTASASKWHTSLPSYFADQHKSYGQA